MPNTNTFKIDDNLLYRRQYFIGPKFVSRFNSWNKIKIGENLHITAHPDLTITTVKSSDTELALLGFMFDPFNSKANNDEILTNILNSSGNFDQTIKATDQYSGRWILIYSKQSESKLFHDPAGLRQIFYTKTNSEVWCSAQPHILADILNLKKRTDPDLLNFINSKYYEIYEHNMVGDETIFNNIHHLYPNHYLDLDTGGYARYWPTQILDEPPLEEVTQACNEMLVGLLKAANHRHDLTQAVTGGWDTRLLLAASKEFSDDIYYFVHQLPNLNDDHADIRVPRKLFPRLGLDFHVLDCTAYNEGFDDLLKKNSFAFQTALKNFQHYNYFNNFQDKLNISGNSNPLFKVGLPRIDEISPFTLARLLGFHNQTYAIDRISKWLDQTQPYAEKYNIHIVTLFYWEIRFGNWAPMFNAALDLSTEEFAPFNCRKMINLILGLDDKYRMPSNMLVYQEMIKTLWPEVLLEPVNPGRYGLLKKIKTAFINNTFILLKRIGMYNIVRTIFRNLMRHK